MKGTDGQEVKIRRKNEEEDRERARGWEERTTLSMIFFFVLRTKNTQIKLENNSNKKTKSV